MKRALTAIVAIAAGCRPDALGETKTPSAMQNHGDIELQPLDAPVKTVEDIIYPTLINGTPADPKDFPASVSARMNNAGCTATVVGPEVLLIAAHCVGNGASAAFKLQNGVSYTSKCTHHSGYSSDATADYALCKIGAVVTDTLFETVNIDASRIKVGDKIQLTGYGCTQPGGSGGNDGVYRVGLSTVKSVHAGNQDIVTEGGAALCFGDSGGPAFFYTNESKKERVQLSVNSRGDIRAVSYLSSLSAGKFLPFAKDWISKNSAKICGVDGFMTGCRGENKTPPDPELPPHCIESLKFFSNCLIGLPRGAIKEPEACRKSYAELFACEEAAELTN